VSGELHRGRRSQNGHFYFELVEKGRGDEIVGKLDAVIWRKDFERVARILAQAEQRLEDGQQLRCWGQLDFYPPTGKLQMVVRELDPLHTLGHLERRRRETLAWLQGEGLIEANGRLALSGLPFRIGLVTSKESAAYHDFLTGLADSGLAFQVLLVHASMQGARAEIEVASALDLLAAARPAGRPLDALVVVRGGGSRSDLAAFDSRLVARAMARCPLPVLCGLGHEIDRTIADLVCHTSLKTPTMVAEFLAMRVLETEARLLAAERRLAAAAGAVLQRAGRELRRFERLPQLAAGRLATARLRVDQKGRSLSQLAARRLREAERRLGEQGRRLAQAAPRAIARRRPLAEERARLIVRRVKDLLGRHQAWLDGAARLCHQVAPERLLERGFSITRDASLSLLRAPDQVRSGDMLTTRTAGGLVRSRVEGAE
jgi:exodeoxyribonuclease VII large subunit